MGAEDENDFPKHALEIFAWRIVQEIATLGDMPPAVRLIEIAQEVSDRCAPIALELDQRITHHVSGNA